MKSNRFLLALFLSILIFTVDIGAQQESNQTAQQPVIQPQQEQKAPGHTVIQLDKPYTQELNKDNNFTAKYLIDIPQIKVMELKQEKWYIFVQVETAEQFQWQKTKIQLFLVKDAHTYKPIKQCDTYSGLDSCFLTSSNFDYKSQQIQARVTCEEFCKFTLSAEITAKYKLKPNQALQMDFENTAYSKLFSLDTNSFEDFRRLQIILKPKSFLSFDAPIKLYANRGETIPTNQKHDYSSIHLWDDGLGIFINYPDACNKFTVLVQGPQKNVLTLSTKIVQQNKPISTVRFQPYFSYIESQQIQVFQIDINKTQKTYIKLTTLTGSLEMSGIKDQNMKSIQMQFTPLSRSYGQLQYKFEPSFYEKNKDFNISQHLYIQVKSNKDTTFVFQSYTNEQTLNFLIPQLNRYSDLQAKSYDMYYLRLAELQSDVNPNNKEARIQLMTTTFQTIDLGVKVFLCKADAVAQCQPTKQQVAKLNNNESIDNEKRKQLKNIPQDTSMPGVKYLDVAVQFEEFVVKDQIVTLNVIVLLTNPLQVSILYTLQYIDMGKTYFLKEKQLKRDRLAIDSIKYYTFINNDQDVKEIRIHSIQISGEILMVGYQQDPRYNLVEGTQIYEYHGSVTFFNVKPGQKIFLEVQGIDSAYYSLYLQLIRESQVKPDDKGNQGYNQIVIQENIQYDFFIKSKQKIILQLHSSVSNFELIIGSHLPLDLCLTQNFDQPPFTPYCEISQTLTKNQIIGIKMDKGLIGNMGVTNNNDKAVQFKVELRTKKSEQQCTNSPLSILNTWTTKASNQTTKQITCYKFNINRRQNLQLIVQLLNMDFDNATISWQLNDKQKQILMNPMKLIMKNQLQKVCGKNVQDGCDLTITIESNTATDVQAVVQFLDKDIILIDGMAHPSFTHGLDQQPKYFRYQMLNLVNTTIVLENKVGFHHFYGQIVSRREFYASLPDRTIIFPNKDDQLFKSENPLYYVYQTYQLDEALIKKANCTKQCVLLISVQSTSKDLTEGTPGRFSIQVSQQDRFLKQNQPVMGSLVRQSLAFYEYFNPNPGTIYVQLHNQNMNCAKIFIKKGNNARATASAYDKMTDTESSLILEDAQKGPYSIAVEAKKLGCSYTIQVISSLVKVARVKRGVFSDNIVQANETFHFIYQHFRNQSFKVLTLNKIGQLTIKLKVLQQGQLEKILSTDRESLPAYIANLKYQESGVDYIKVHHERSLYFCTNCTYLISITATKYTETSLIIPSRDVQIPIVQDALIKDELKDNQITKYRIFTSNIAQFKLYVQYGKINFTIVESIENKKIFTHIYEQTKQPIYQKFNSTASKTDDKGFGYDFIHYSIITIQGMANSSIYSFQLLTSEDEQKHGGNVKYGIPEYFYLQPNQAKCFKGFLDDSRQELILSFDNSVKSVLQNLDINLKVGGQKVNYTKLYTVSEMTLQTDNSKISQPTEYEICFNSTEAITLTLIQSAHIFMLPSNTAILMTHSANLTFASKGTTILQMDECSGRSIVSVSSTFNDLHTSGTEINQVRRGNSLIQFYYWGPVFIHLETQGTRLRWREKDTFKQLGVGYQKFAASKASAYKQGESLKIQANPIQQISKYSKSVNSTITQISYKIILAKNQKQLMGSLSCSQGNVLKYENKVSSLNKSTSATFPINQQMKQKFKHEKYFLAGVLANLKIQVNGTIQNYRFIYPMVDIQRQVLFGAEYLRPYEEQNNGNNNSEIFGTILLIIGVIAFLAVLVIVYKKWISKWLRSRKQKLSQQGSSSYKYTEFATMN